MTTAAHARRRNHDTTPHQVTRSRPKGWPQLGRQRNASTARQTIYHTDTRTRRLAQYAAWQTKPNHPASDSGRYRQRITSATHPKPPGPQARRLVCAERKSLQPYAHNITPGVQTLTKSVSNCSDILYADNTRIKQLSHYKQDRLGITWDYVGLCGNGQKRGRPAQSKGRT